MGSNPTPSAFTQWGWPYPPLVTEVAGIVIAVVVRTILRYSFG